MCLGNCQEVKRKKIGREQIALKSSLIPLPPGGSSLLLLLRELADHHLVDNAGGGSFEEGPEGLIWKILRPLGVDEDSRQQFGLRIADQKAKLGVADRLDGQLLDAGSSTGSLQLLQGEPVLPDEPLGHCVWVHLTLITPGETIKNCQSYDQAHAIEHEMKDTKCDTDARTDNRTQQDHVMQDPRRSTVSSHEAARRSFF